MLIQRRSDEIREILLDDTTIATAAITPIEVASALWRQRLSGRLLLDAHQRAEATFAELSRRWIEIAFSPAVVETALRLVTRHSLRSLDAIQLASAMVLTATPHTLPFVTLDKRLIAAADAEGFPILPRP